MRLGHASQCFGHRSQMMGAGTTTEPDAFDPDRLALTGEGGALDFYASAHRVLYPRLNKREFTYEMSDHLPLWVELKCG